MRVIVQVYGISFPGGTKHELKLPEFSTIETAVYALVDILKENTVEELLKYMPLVNGVRANKDSILSESDNVLLLNTLGGG